MFGKVIVEELTTPSIHPCLFADNRCKM